MKEKTGLILEGGGMRAGFVAGAVMALMDKGLTDFNVGVAVSASVPTLTYFASGQREEIEKVWRSELNTPELVCYRNIPAAFFALSAQRPILNIDYLISEVFKKKFPVKSATLLKSKIECFFGLTKMPEGELAILRPAENDIYEIFKAAIALPGCYSKTVSVNGNEYIDGGVVEPLPTRLLFQNGVNRVVAILSMPPDCEREPLGIFKRAICWHYFKSHEGIATKYREAVKNLNKQVDILTQTASDKPSSVLIISPDAMPPMKFISRDQEKINRTIDMGYQKVEALENQIKQFLQN